MYYKRIKLSGKIQYWKFMGVYTDEWGDNSYIFIVRNIDGSLSLQMTPADSCEDKQNFITSMDLTPMTTTDFIKETEGTVFPTNMQQINEMEIS